MCSAGQRYHLGQSTLGDLVNSLVSVAGAPALVKAVPLTEYGVPQVRDSVRADGQNDVTIGNLSAVPAFELLKNVPCSLLSIKKSFVRCLQEGLSFELISMSDVLHNIQKSESKIAVFSHLCQEVAAKGWKCDQANQKSDVTLQSAAQPEISYTAPLMMNYPHPLTFASTKEAVGFLLDQDSQVLVDAVLRFRSQLAQSKLASFMVNEHAIHQECDDTHADATCTIAPVSLVTAKGSHKKVPLPGPAQHVSRQHIL